LGDNIGCVAAEEGLRKLGATAGEELCEATLEPMPSPADETPSSVRRRRSAIRLLTEIHLEERYWPRLEHLMSDHDDAIASIACRIALERRMQEQQGRAVATLLLLSNTSDWLLRDEIQSSLVSHFRLVEAAVKPELASISNPVSLPVRNALHHVIGRAGSSPLRVGCK